MCMIPPHFKTHDRETIVNRMLKNILSGIGSVLVMYPSAGYSHYRGQGVDLERNDLEALRADVRAIGGDFHKAAELGRERVEAEKAKHA